MKRYILPNMQIVAIRGDVIATSETESPFQIQNNSDSYGEFAPTREMD